MEIKDEIGDSDVLVARDRLKGALRELLQHSDTGSSADSSEECSTQDYKHPMKKMTKSVISQQPQRKIRRRRQMQADTTYHHTYVMKLFDRSVDLGQFQEEMPLYPICRAWVVSHPKNPNVLLKMSSNPEASNESIGGNGLSGEINEVHYLPPPLPSEEEISRNRIPSPILEEKDDLNLDYEGQILKSQEELLKEHSARWNAIRKKWHQQAQKNEQRYIQSATILNSIFYVD